MSKPDGRKNLIKIKGGGHVEHHAETYDDMSLKKDPKWRKTKAAASLDADEFRGTAFTWQTTGLMTIQMIVGGTLPVFALLGFTLLETIAVLLPGMLVHALVWNMLHPPMHGLPKVPASIGAPSAWPFGLDDKIRDSFYFKWIYENHQGHHVLGGQGNYNVCCPGFDHVMGTYIPVTRWQPKMRAVPASDATERWGFPVSPAGVPEAPIISKDKVTKADLTPTALLRKDGSLVHDIEGEGTDTIIEGVVTPIASPSSPPASSPILKSAQLDAQRTSGDAKMSEMSDERRETSDGAEEKGVQ